MSRIYCAGPLFNEPERGEMAAIAAALEAAGHQTFLPQRDGFELAHVRRRLEGTGVSPAESRALVHRAIFCLDIYHLLGWADAAVANLNGRVPDEGTVVEAALAWHAGKGLVLYKSDRRAPFAGDDNPMVTGFTDLAVTSRIDELAAAVDAELADGDGGQVRRTLDLGERIARFRAGDPDAAQLARFLSELGADGWRRRGPAGGSPAPGPK